MKNCFLIFLLLISWFWTDAQSLDRITLISGTVLNDMMTATIGEACVFSLSGQIGSLDAGSQSGDADVFPTNLIPNSLDSALFFEISPNPVNNFLTILISEGINDDGFASICDVYGNFISGFQLYKGKYQYVIDVCGLPAGTYFIAFKLNRNRKNFYRIFVKQ